MEDVFSLDVNQPYAPWCFRFQRRRFGSSAGHDGGASPGAHGAPGAAGRLRLAAGPQQCHTRLVSAAHSWEELFIRRRRPRDGLNLWEE